MKLLLVVFSLAMVPSINSLCAIQGCSKWWNAGAKNNVRSLKIIKIKCSIFFQVSITGACAVMFDENCCKASKTFHIVNKGEEGKLCGTVSSLIPISSCKGPNLKDDIEVSHSASDSK